MVLPVSAPYAFRVSCDSLVALSTATADGSVLFAKNSDRPATECQPLVQLHRRQHAEGTALRCQYIEIPQVAETARMIGSQPFWLWGFEHGMNEYGVVIGNHTVFTKDGLSTPGLIGMDLVRLGLERGRNAAAALDVIAGLVEQYGQGGSGYVDKDWPYHNSFLIADAHEAYLLETSDHHWASRRIAEVGSASNHLTIGRDWEARSAHLVEHAVEEGWWVPQGEQRFDFAAAYRDTTVAPPVVSSGRYRRTCELLDSERGRLTPALLQRSLRDHYGGPFPPPNRLPSDEQYFSVCMHAEPVGTTTASMVARLTEEREDLPRYWGSLGSPCVGVFLPYYIDGELPAILGRGGADVSDDSPWWLFKRLLTAVEKDWERRAAPVRDALDELERDIADRAAAVESDARALRRRGEAKAASTILTEFMHQNVDRTLARVRALIFAENSGRLAK